MQKLSAPNAFGFVSTMSVIMVFTVSLLSCASPPAQTTAPLSAYPSPATTTLKPDPPYPAPSQNRIPTAASTDVEAITEIMLPPTGDSPTATLRLVLSEPAHLSNNLQDLLGAKVFGEPNRPSEATSVVLPKLPFQGLEDEGWTMSKPCDPNWEPVTYRTNEGVIMHNQLGGFEFNGWRYEHIQSIYRDCGDYEEDAHIGRWQPVIVSDGTLESTTLLQDANDFLVQMGGYIAFDNRMFFDARTTGIVSSDFGECSVWRIDGPPESLQPILGDGCTGRRGGPRYLLTISRDRLFIGLADKFGGKQLFQSDGTKEGTQQIANLGTYGYNLREMIVADERLYLLMEQRLLAYDLVVE